MIFSPLVLALLPFASASVHKLKLHKFPDVTPNHQLETAYLAQKYGVQRQLPIIGSGGAGRRLQLENEEELYWTQEEIQGGHGVPLTSMSGFYRRSRALLTVPRLYECSVLQRNYPRYSPSICTFTIAIVIFTHFWAYIILVQGYFGHGVHLTALLCRLKF